MHLRGWISFFQEAPNERGDKRSDSSIRSYGITLHAFCRWLEREEVIEKPSPRALRCLAPEQKFVSTFTPEEVGKLLEACHGGNKHSRN